MQGMGPMGSRVQDGGGPRPDSQVSASRRSGRGFFPPGGAKGFYSHPMYVIQPVYSKIFAVCALVAGRGVDFTRSHVIRVREP